MDIAADNVQAPQPPFNFEVYRRTMCLAYQSLGIVFGDLSVSPIYVYKNTFSGNSRLHEGDYEILGVLSLILWTLTLIPLCKYIILVLSADDQGEGGTFALYSLLCRNSNIGHFFGAPAARQVARNHPPPTIETKVTFAVKRFFDQSVISRYILLLVVLIGTSMVIGDGILTPSMSVLSAVSGIKIKLPYITEYVTVFVACVIMVFIFSLQHFGTQKVGFLFAPFMVLWLLGVGVMGLYNLIYWNPGVIKAVSPYYAYKFFRVAGKGGWSSLGGVVLSITGAEAMFADLGHFSQLSLRIAFASFVYPCLIFAYMGEAAYLSKHREDLQSSFFKAIPERFFWPMFVIATLATIVASQAIISAIFSIIAQCRALKCFPRVKIVHTSNELYGRIYIPEINWMLMLLCIAVVIGFRDTDAIGNAYGLAAISVMFVTTCLMFLIIVVVWRRPVIWGLAFVVAFGSVELLYMSACLEKIPQGGWVPLVLSFIILGLMSIWKYGTLMKQSFEQENMLSEEAFLLITPQINTIRTAGVVLVYTHLTTGIPPMLSRLVVNFPAFHEVAIFVTIQTLLVPRVPLDERFTITRVGWHISDYTFRCVVRYGYMDYMDAPNFETELLDSVRRFLQIEPFPLQVVHRQEPEPSPAADAREVGIRIREFDVRELEQAELESASLGLDDEVVDFLGSEVPLSELASVSVDVPESSPAAAAARRSFTDDIPESLTTDAGGSVALHVPESSAGAVGVISVTADVPESSPAALATRTDNMETPESSAVAAGKRVMMDVQESSPEAAARGSVSMDIPESSADAAVSRKRVRFSVSEITEDASAATAGPESSSSGASAMARNVVRNQLVLGLDAANENGPAYMIANTTVVAKSGSSCLKKFAIDVIYRFLRQNSRQPAVILRLPTTSLIEVGVIYDV